jgi:nitrogen fixation/metabolism regulation signal transduction histidine kinase
MAEEGPARNRRTLKTLRSHLWLSGSIATLCFAVVLGLSIFMPIAMQLGRTDLRSAEAYGLAQHFLFLHSALWPLVLLSLIASIATANVLFQRMREPLVRFVRCYESLEQGVVPPQITIRGADYLADEADALNGMIASLRRQQAVRSEAVARLEEAIGDLASRNVPEGILSELQDIAKRLSVSPAGGARDASVR